MKTYKYILILLLALMPSIVAHAQIGYQVSLLNSATGQPRAGETVIVDIKLTNSEDATVYTTQQKATSNDFGVLSLSVGDANTFDKLDWNKLPLYIEVSIDGVLIAKSQVLSVPVAEYAKKSGFVLTKEFLASKEWVRDDGLAVLKLSFLLDGYVSANVTYYRGEWAGKSSTRSYQYDIVDSNKVYLYAYSEDDELYAFSRIVYNPNMNALLYEDNSVVGWIYK